MFNNKNILITGGTGSFGKKFTKYLLTKYKPNKIIIFSRDEYKQFNMKNELNLDKHRFFLGDVRIQNDYIWLLRCRLCNSLCCLKQVEALEYNPFEAVKTNIIGAQNLITSCLENKVKKVIALSTDKASALLTYMGLLSLHR